MYIKSLMVHNFKSIDTVQIDFNPMTMIIGANARYCRQKCHFVV